MEADLLRLRGPAANQSFRNFRQAAKAGDRHLQTFEGCGGLETECLLVKNFGSQSPVLSCFRYGVPRLLP